MGRFKTVTIAAAILICAIIMTAPSFTFAFHEGGSDYCSGCHGQHDDDNNPGSRSAGFMLKGSDPSSTCLRCHSRENQTYNVLSKNGGSYTAGGDYYWLGKTFSWTEGGQLHQSLGDNHGHNIVAAEYGMNPDAAHRAAHGGVYPSDEMGCTSCHDPHERSSNDPGSGVFRLLGGVGYQQNPDLADTLFQFPVPMAAADPYDWTETDARHTAYGSGMSEWCANCHVDYVGQTGRSTHPAGNNVKLNGQYTRNYNSYVKTGDFTGNQASAYLALVPFETGVHDASLLDPTSSQGPEGDANVMCLTCHRAHASAFENMGRWDFSATFLKGSHPGENDGGVTGNDVLNSYYGRNLTAEFGPYQRQLCNKCHVKD